LDQDPPEQVTKANPLNSALSNPQPRNRKPRQSLTDGGVSLLECALRDSNPPPFDPQSHSMLIGAHPVMACKGLAIGLYGQGSPWRLSEVRLKCNSSTSGGQYKSRRSAHDLWRNGG
jgi:hypothetical protein